MVALLLPLSSLWAGMTTTEAGSSLNIAQLWGSSQPLEKNYSSASDSGRKTFGSRSSGPSSTFLSERKGSTAPIITGSAKENVPKVKLGRDSTEVDLEMMGVRVDRSYSVHSGKGFGGVGMA
jgi:pheromone alpha factor receptor